MGTKVEVKTIPLHGLFIHRKQVWRSLSKLRAESHSTSSQKVFINDHNTEVSIENADFIDGLKVTLYDGEIEVRINPAKKNGTRSNREFVLWNTEIDSIKKID